MNSVYSSILIIGSAAKTSLGADFVNGLAQAKKLIEQKKHSVYVLHCTKDEETEYNQIFRDLRKSNHLFELLLCGSDLSLKILEGLRAFYMTDSASDPLYEQQILVAVERVLTTRQNQQLLELIHEQNKKLLLFSRSLEDRIAKRQTYLQKTHLSITETNHRGEAFQRALIAVHRSNNIAEMEQGLAEAIAESFGISWVRLSLGQNKPLFDKIQQDRLNFAVHTMDLKLQGEVLGSVSFGRKVPAFTKAEKDFFAELSDSIALAIGRLKILRDTEEIKLQWEATFNSITSPLALIDSNYVVKRANGAFLVHASAGKKHCYELLMNRTSPCEHCQIGQKFRIDRSGNLGKVHILDVSSQKIPGQDVYVNIYRDISSQLQIETRIMESAKIAELGTIGSSIAHELNNPLSGIITFIQLVKMDMKGSEKYFSDILALEAAAQKCKEIIQNLLSFSRAPDREEDEVLDLNTVVKRSMQIVELQSRSSEVVVKTDLSSVPLNVKTNSGMLSHAFMTYLQLAIESARSNHIHPINLKIRTSRKDASHKGYTGSEHEVFIVSPKVPASFQGPELLRRTIAERVLADLGAYVEYFAEIEDQVVVKIAFRIQKLPPEV